MDCYNLIMRISPFYFIILFYFISNLIFALFAIYGNYMIVEYHEYHIIPKKMWEALFFQFFSMIFLIIFYEFFARKKFNNIEDSGFGNKAGYFLLIYQLFFIFLAIYFGLGVVGNSEQQVSYILILISNFISSDALFFIIGSQLKSIFLFKLNIIFYIISTLLRGWMGGILIAIFIYLCRIKSISISLRNMVFILIFALTLIFISPFLIDLKFGIRGGGNITLDTSAYSDRLILAINYIFSRLQHVGNIYLISIKDSFYSSIYEQNKIKSYYMDGILQDVIYRRLGNILQPTFGAYAAINEFGGYDWNINTGISGWFYILKEKSFFLIIYWSLLLASIYYYVYRYATKELFLTVSVFSVVYLYHGWFSSFFNFIFIVFIVVFLKRLKV